MKGQLCLLILILPMLAHAQSGDATNGIKWSTESSWEQVKQKAKTENKYIFLDCYTTWCGPCKRMEKETYPNDSVGIFMNEKFISVKAQMDKTQKDNAFVQSWYNDVAEIEKHYMVNAYPTLLFFSPNGDLVHKEIGFLSSGEFVSKANIALIPGQKLQDDYVEYQRLIKAYKNGDVNYSSLPFMVTIAKKIGDTISRELVRVHTKYVSGLTEQERYTKENIEFWASLDLFPQHKIVQFFYYDVKMIDKIMCKKGYAAKQVDKNIQNFIVEPFIYKSLKDPAAKLGVTTINAATGTKMSNPSNYDEADWKELEKQIRKDFSNCCTKRNLLKAKSEWYEKNRNWIAYSKTSIMLFKKFPPDYSNWDGFDVINLFGWNVFLFVNDHHLIERSLIYMKRLVDTFSYDQTNGHIDTYANLLYKIGRKKEAIYWEEKSAKLNPSDQLVQKALIQMKKGESTYGVKVLVPSN